MEGSDRDFDVIVWGATGFTGRLVAEYLALTYGVGRELRWAIAGRSADKLASIASMARESQAEELPQLLADINDPDSIDQLVQKTRVICTTVGPYALYGSVMVEACVKHGTHCCDLTGETPWMRKMIDQYQTAAEASGAKIVHTCGFDSIPSDIGVYFLQQCMREKYSVQAAEIKYRVVSSAGGVSGGTVASMMNMMDEAKTDKSIFETLQDPYALNPLNQPRGPDGNDQMGTVYDHDFRQWTGPFMMAGINTRVVRRSNALLNYSYGREFRYSEAILTGSGPGGYIRALLVALGTGLMGLLAALGPTRALLKKMLPAPGEGPSEQARNTGHFNIELLGKHALDESKNIRIRVTGDKDPGYGATSKMLAESAVCLAMDSLTEGGGFLTPASAMGDQLVKRLQQKAGMGFHMI
ncbi:MAG TPA: saccharopine dehydrogenase [Gammaproteobacteria bacterium]|nr:saccharopine dehydrogenase [Gammaproteobacteria bacterium]HIK69644.1 saccharopine dehydrogenase [Pseudomonadales bacterium]